MKKINLLLCAMLLCLTAMGAKEKVNQESYPEFSWDKVPVYMHVSKGNGSEDFTPEEIKRLAEFPLIAIEKNQGLRKHGNMEAGTKVAAEAIKALNPNAKILFYFNVALDYGSMYSHGIILGDDKHPEWAMKDLKGNYILHTNNPKKRFYDYSVPEFRRWWVDTIIKNTDNDWLDGVFIDGLPKIVAGAQNKERNWGKEHYWAHYNGVHTALEDLKNKYNGKKLMVGNALRGYTFLLPDLGLHFLDTMDGGMIEGFGIFSDMPADVVANQIHILQEAAARGKMAIVGANPLKKRLDKDYDKLSSQEKRALLKDDIELPLAVFLIGAGKYSYFFYSTGYREDSGCMDYFDELNRPLGPPKGLAKKKGWVYTREFEHASVWVNVDTKECKITWR